MYVLAGRRGLPDGIEASQPDGQRPVHPNTPRLDRQGQLGRDKCLQQRTILHAKRVWGGRSARLACLRVDDQGGPPHSNDGEGDLGRLGDDPSAVALEEGHVAGLENAEDVQVQRRWTGRRTEPHQLLGPINPCFGRLSEPAFCRSHVS